MSMSEFMTADELCAYLNITPDQLKRIRQRREIAWYKFGGTPHFKREDADAYAARQKVKAVIERPVLVTDEKRGPGRPQKTTIERQYWHPGQKVV